MQEKNKASTGELIVPKIVMKATAEKPASTAKTITSVF